MNKKNKKIMLLTLLVMMCFIFCGCSTILNSKKNSQNIKELAKMFPSNPNTIYSFSIISKNNNGNDLRIDYVKNTDCTLFYNEKNVQLDETKLERLLKEINDYAPNVMASKDDYWPANKENLDMDIVFAFSMKWEDENGEKMKYSQDGATGYPKDWKKFLEKIEKELK